MRIRAQDATLIFLKALTRNLWRADEFPPRRDVVRPLDEEHAIDAPARPPTNASPARRRSRVLEVSLALLTAILPSETVTGLRACLYESSVRTLPYRSEA
jgi:hypothetical protein